jgi:pilus assembly protein Flp/PilA
MINSHRKQGQGLVEYAIIILLVVVVVIIVIYFFGPAIGNLYSNVVQSI